MYGRENNDVVNPTSAVSATRNTLNGSTKSWRSSTIIGPSAITRTVSAHAATNTSALIATLIAGAMPRCPTTARIAAPATGRPSTARISIILFSRPPRRTSRIRAHVCRAPRSLALPQALHVLEVEAVELLAYLEEEHAEDQHPDQHV